jgi:hypothetical protein
MKTYLQPLQGIKMQFLGYPARSLVSVPTTLFVLHKFNLFIFSSMNIGNIFSIHCTFFNLTQNSFVYFMFQELLHEEPPAKKASCFEIFVNKNRFILLCLRILVRFCGNKLRL